MPYMAVPGGAPEVAYDIRCTSCGFLGACPESLIGSYIVNHYSLRHPLVDEIRFDEHYTAVVSPLRCDVCTGIVELPYWTHTDRTGGGHDGLGKIVDRDGRWLVCDSCHVMLASRNVHGLLLRNWARSLELQPNLANLSIEDKAAARATITTRMRSLFTRLDGGQRNTVKDPGPLS